MKLKKGIILNSYNGEFTAYDSANSTMHELNESAFYILDNMVKNVNKDKMASMYAMHFELSIDQAREDISQFLDLLKSRAIIE